MLISELISVLTSSHDQVTVARLETAFRDAEFGLLVIGLPAANPGQKIRADSSGSLKIRYVHDANGKKMIKACADPELFNANFPGCINATATGLELLSMAENLNDADGILLCSAASSHSFPIYKSDFTRIKSLEPPALRRKWWEFWKIAG